MRLIFMFVLLGTLGVYGQEKNISGYVYDAEGNGIPYATITCINHQNEVFTNADGFFRMAITIPDGDLADFLVTATGYELNEEKINLGNGKNFHLDFHLKRKVNQLQEVVISSDKIAQQLNKVPVSSSVISKKTVNDFHLNSIEEIAYIAPNFNFVNVGSTTHSMIAVRGITAYSPEPSAALYIDGVNQFDMTSLNNSLFDIKKIEILRGPQSTLFGRNAMGGVINIITEQPNNISSGSFKAIFGNYGTQQYSATYKTPIIKDKLYSKWGIQYQKRDGYFTNAYTNKTFDNKEDVAANFSLRYNINASWNINYNSNFQFNNEKGVFPFAANDSIALANPYVTNQNRSSGTERTIWNNALSLKYKGDDINFSSVTSYQYVNRKFKDTLDRDYSPYDLQAFIAKGNHNSIPIHVIAEELRLSSANDKNNKLDWQLGTYAFMENKEENYDQVTGADAVQIQGDTLAPYINTTYSDLHNYGIAFFGQVSYKILPKLEATGGLRYDYEHRKNKIKSGFIKGNSPEQITFPETTRKAAYHSLSPKVALNYEFNSHLNTYISYSRGYRSGGINPYTINPNYQIYDPEYSDNYELGVKANLLDNKLNIYSSVFFIDWKDQQVNTLIPGQGVQMGTLNVGRVESKGIELEISAKPITNLLVSYSAAYTDAYYKKLPLPNFQTGEIEDYSGNKQIITPDFTSRLAAHYMIPFKFKTKSYRIGINADWKYIGSQYFDFVNTIRQGSYHLLNASAGVSNKHFSLDFFCKNLTKTKYLNFVFPFGGTYSLIGNPQTYGISLTAKF